MTEVGDFSLKLVDSVFIKHLGINHVGKEKLEIILQPKNYLPYTQEKHKFSHVEEPENLF